MLNYMEKMEKHLLLMAIDSNYIMKKKIIMTKGKQSLPSFPKNELQKQELSVIILRAMFNLIPVLASTSFSAKLLKYLSKEVKLKDEVLLVYALASVSSSALQSGLCVKYKPMYKPVSTARRMLVLLGSLEDILRFEICVKAKDLYLWHIILNGDFPPVAKNEVTQILEVVPFEEQSDDLKNKLVKNNEAKMVLYNALPKKEYERIFMCKTAKDIWKSLLITHQGNSQVKDNKIDLLVQQYEQFTILDEESIDSGFARFNTIITRLKALDERFSSKNYLIHEVVMEKDSEIYRGKHERIKSIALKAKKESSDDETSTSGSDDEEYAMAVRNFKKFFRRKGKFVRQPREERKSF
ncbi:hypothetical protein Tco_0901489 [Tanacetum coccineum]